MFSKLYVESSSRVSLLIVLFSKLILHFKAFLKTLGISYISFSVKVSNFHLSANHKSGVISSVSLSTFSHREYTLYFPSFIITVSLSSRVVNSFATFHKAFMSLDK
jgi:hypothetical protein